MPDILFICEGCGRHLAVDSEGKGVEVTCPDCQTALKVPEIFLKTVCINCGATILVADPKQAVNVKCLNCRENATARVTAEVNQQHRPASSVSRMHLLINSSRRVMAKLKGKHS